MKLAHLSICLYGILTITLANPMAPLDRYRRQINNENPTLSTTTTSTTPSPLKTSTQQDIYNPNNDSSISGGSNKNSDNGVGDTAAVPNDQPLSFDFSFGDPDNGISEANGADGSANPSESSTSGNPTGMNFNFGSKTNWEDGIDVGDPVDPVFPFEFPDLDVADEITTKSLPSDQGGDNGDIQHDTGSFPMSFNFGGNTPDSADSTGNNGDSQSSDSATDNWLNFDFGVVNSPPESDRSSRNNATSNGNLQSGTDSKDDTNAQNSEASFNLGSNSPPESSNTTDVVNVDGNSQSSTDDANTPNSRTNFNFGSNSPPESSNDNRNDRTNTDSDLNMNGITQPVNAVKEEDSNRNNLFGVVNHPITESPSKSGENKTFNFGQGQAGDWENGATVSSRQTISGLELPDRNIVTEITDNSSAEVQVKKTTEEPDETLLRRQRESTSTLRPLEERVCEAKQTHMACLHGYCNGYYDGEGGHNFECVCDEGWVGLFCSDPCTLKCQNGVCRLKDPQRSIFLGDLREDEMECNCQFEWTGDRCEELKPDPEENVRILAAILTTALCLTIILAIITPLVMWRMRVIVIMKLVYFFQGFEDDDGKQYDAYVSMSPTPEAESFVYHILLPKLEDQGFKLFIQVRDQLGGTIISDSIYEAIEKSRRTIMIVTPEYIQHEWARFEYLIAQEETLKLRQRIIPIILTDIEKDKLEEDKTLKHILKSVKCLRCPVSLTQRSTTIDDLSPGSAKSPDPLMSTVAMLKERVHQEKKENKFWKRLELTMPKKKSSEEGESSFNGVSTIEDHLGNTESNKTTFDISSEQYFMTGTKISEPGSYPDCFFKNSVTENVDKNIVLLNFLSNKL